MAGTDRKPTWFAVHDAKTGELRSIGTVVADAKHLAAQGLTATALGETAPDQQTHRWDKDKKAFVERVKVDRLNDLLADAKFATAHDSLSATQQAALKDALIAFLGPLRYRQDDDPTTLG
jgi:hypothetical protein